MEVDDPLARLSQLRTESAELDRVRRRLDAARAELSTTRVRLGKLRERLSKERADVARLEGLGLRALFHAVLGDKKEQLEKERQEHLAARLALESAADGARALEEEIGTLERRGSELEGLRARFGDLAASPKVGVMARQVIEHVERAAALEGTLQEIDEARDAGQDAAQALLEVQRSLRSAGNWGLFDMVGGGLIATAVKHSKMDDARALASRASAEVARFRRELADVRRRPDLTVDLGGFGTFADYFFDGLIVDWVVQSRIHDAQRRVESCLNGVNRSLQQLALDRTKVRVELDSLRSAR